MNQIAFAIEQTVHSTREITPDLCSTMHSGPEALPAISTLRVDKSVKNRITNRCSRLRVQASMVNKSVATISFQCCVRNSFQVVFQIRSDAGSMPCRRRISAMVLPAMSCPRLKRAPGSDDIPSAVSLRHPPHQRLHLVGLPRPAWLPVPLPSYLCAISRRCQASSVSCVTIVALPRVSFALTASPWPPAGGAARQ